MSNKKGIQVDIVDAIDAEKEVVLRTKKGTESVIGLDKEYKKSLS